MHLSILTMNDQYPFTISILIPAYNEGASLPGTVSAIERVMQEYGYEHETIIINDGSTDATQEESEALAARFDAVRYVSHDMNRGKGAAIQTGVREARGEYILFLDADHSVHIENIAPFMDAVRDCDIVIGSIGLKEADIFDVHHPYRRVLGSVSKVCIRMCATPGIYDTQRGFKLFKHAAAKDIFSQLSIHRWGFDIEALVMAQQTGLIIKEMPVAWNNTKRSNIGILDYFKTLRELGAILWNKWTGKYTSLK